MESETEELNFETEENFETEADFTEVEEELENEGIDPAEAAFMEGYIRAYSEED